MNHNTPSPTPHDTLAARNTGASERNRNTAMPYERQSSTIESDDFPFETFSSIAEVESWRKEVHLPIYHILSQNVVDGHNRATCKKLKGEA